MNIVDIVLGAILLLSAFQGFKKGLFVALAGLVGLIAGLYGAIHFSYYAADYLAERTSWGEQTINLAAFAITFVIIIILISITGKILTKIADFAMLGIINKLAGGVFEVLKYALIISVVLMFLDNANRKIGVVSEEALAESVLYTPIKSIAPAVLPQIIQKAKEHDIYDFENEKETP